MGEETTITVRGVDLDVWKEFQKAIIDKYGNLYGYLGQELTKALDYWLQNKQPSAQGGAQELKPGKSVKSMIKEALQSLGGEATIQQVSAYVKDRYHDFNLGSISTGMSDLSVNGSPSSLYPKDKRILERVSRGRYRLLRQEADEK